MRSAWEERLLALTLGEVLGSEGPPDRTVEILTAWRRAGTKRRRGRSFAVAASVLLLLGTWLAWKAWWDAPVAPAPVLTASTPLVIGDARGTVRSGSRVQVGERAATAGTVHLTLSEPAARLDATDPRVEVLGGPAHADLELAGGRWVIETHEQPLRIRLLAQILTIGPNSRVECLPWFRRDGDTEEDWATQGKAAPRTWEIHVVRGHAGTSSWKRAAGEGLLLPPESPPAAIPPASAEGRQLVARLLEVAARLEETAESSQADPTRFEADKELAELTATLRDVLPRDLALTAETMPRLLPLLGSVDPSVGNAAFRLLLADPALRQRRAIRERLEGDDARLDLDLVLAYGERTEDPVVLEHVTRRIRGRRSVFDVYPALYLAQRGEEAGRGALEAAVAQPDQLTLRTARYLGAAAGLYQLGDPTAWDRARERLRALVQEKLDEGDLDTARWFVAVADYFAAPLRGRPSVSVVGMSRPIMEHQRTLEIESAADVLRILDRLP